MPLEATPAPAAEPGPCGLILDFAGVLTADPREPSTPGAGRKG